MNKLLIKYNRLSLAAKASLWFVICNCIQSGIKFIALPIFANIMTIDDYGMVTLYTSWMSIICIFATLSLGKANGVFYVAMARYPKDRDLFASSMAGLTVILCVLCFGIIYISTIIVGDWMGIGLSQYPAMCVELIGYGIVLLWSLRMRYDYAYKPLLFMTLAYSVATIFVPVLGVIICPAGVSPVTIKNWCGAVSSFLVGIIAFTSLYRRSKKVVDLKYWKIALKFNIPLVPHYLSNVILVQSDRIMIAIIISEAVAAIYNVAYTLGVAIQVITQALLNAINPWIYQKIEEGASNKVRKVISPMLIMVSFLVMGICMIMPEVFGFVFPAAYADALCVIPPVAAGVIWAFIFNLFACIELYFSGNKLVSLSSMTGAIINIIANLIFIPKYGFVAAAYTTLLSDIIYTFMHTYFATKLLRKHLSYINVIPIVSTWMIGILSTIGCFAILLLYPYPIARYMILTVGIIWGIWKRKRISQIIKFKSM